MNRPNTSAHDDSVALGLQTSIDMDVCMTQEHGRKNSRPTTAPQGRCVGQNLTLQETYVQ
jgi:hypothetical protein